MHVSHYIFTPAYMLHVLKCDVVHIIVLSSAFNLKDQLMLDICTLICKRYMYMYMIMKKNLSLYSYMPSINMYIFLQIAIHSYSFLCLLRRLGRSGNRKAARHAAARGQSCTSDQARIQYFAVKSS